MGYYSNVMLVTNLENRGIVESVFERIGEDTSMGNLLLAAENPDGFEYEDHTGPYYNRKTRKLIMWEWKDMRWTGYDSWNDYVALEKALEDALTYDDSHGTWAHYGLIVLGEDTDDNRLEGSPWDYGMGIDREITW